MVEILPEKLIDFIEAKCGSLATTPDFFDVIGQVCELTQNQVQSVTGLSNFFLFFSQIPDTKSTDPTLLSSFQVSWFDEATAEEEIKIARAARHGLLI